jgi:ferredoxin
MEINSPTWQLKQNCPCCNQGYLELFTCVDCGNLIAICEEVGTIFPNPKQINAANISDDNQKCIRCGNESNFRIAKDIEIINFGLTIDDYE